MTDVPLSAQALIERLGREEQQLKRLGLHAQAAGVRTAITILIREAHAAGDPPPPIEPSSDAP